MSPTYDVLLVEDNEAERYLFRRSCESAKFSRRLHEVGDGREALEFLYRRGQFTDAPTPDVILLDLNLPFVSGQEVLRQIKSDPALRVIPVIVLTSSVRAEDVIECYDLGASAYVRKPDQYERFCSVVERLEKFWFDIAVLPAGAQKEMARARAAQAR